MYIPEEEVRSLLTWQALIPAIRQALIDFSAGPEANQVVDQPPRSILRSNHTTGPDNGWFAAMPVVYQDVMAVKTVTFFPGNAELGLHTHMAIIELLSRTTGQPLAIMDGRLITEMRTAAVSAVALDSMLAALVPREARSLGILGSGVQARSHLAAFRLLRPELTDVRIWSRTRSNAEKLASESSARSTNIEEAAAADVVLVATASPTPVLMGRWLKPDALVISVGAVGPTVRELDDETLHSSYIVAESRQAAERESGDIVLSSSRVQAEIGEILPDPACYPFPRQQRVLFKSVGMAIEDLVAARLVWQASQSP